MLKKIISIMNRLVCSIFSVILISCLGSTLSYSANFKIMITAKKANVRLKPDMNSTIIATMVYGTELNSTGLVGEWYQVSLPPDNSGIALIGYIYKDLAKVVENGTIRESSKSQANEKETIDSNTEVEHAKPVKKKEVNKVPMGNKDFEGSNHFFARGGILFESGMHFIVIGGFEHYIKNNLSFGAEFGYSKIVSVHVRDILGEERLSISALSITGNVNYYFDADSNIKPYVTGGFGVFNLPWEYTDEFVKINGSMTSVLLAFGGGFKYPISSYYLVADARLYVWTFKNPENYSWYASTEASFILSGGISF